MASTGVVVPLINGREYGWGDIRVHVLNRTLIGITAIKYDDEQDMDMHYGQGNYPQNYGIGKYKAKASLTLQMKELLALQNSLTKGLRIQDIAPFEIEVTYLNESNEVITDTLHNCKFKNNGRDVKSGDTIIEKEVELILSHISWGSK